MMGQSLWGYKPYSRLDEYKKRNLPFITKIAPKSNYIEIQWMDNDDNGEHDIYYKRRFSIDNYIKVGLLKNTSTYKIENLMENTDYEFYISRRQDEKAKSDLRLARTGNVPGVVVNYLHPDDNAYDFSGNYLCSPSIIRLPSGNLLASMDIFKGNGPQNLSLIFKSEDNGKTWSYVTDLFPCFWGKLFYHRNKLYMLAHRTEYGDLIIGSSTDEGETWNTPTTILPGGSNKDVGPHKAPMPIIEAGGRLYTAIDYGSWLAGGHANGLISIDENLDLEIAGNWICTGFTKYDDKWKGAAKGNSGGGLEGNAVVGLDGEIYNFLRYQINKCNPSYGKALILKGEINMPEKPLEFHKIVDFNGGSNSKFDLIYDNVSKHYYAIVNEVINPKTPNQRNVLSFAKSKDFENFKTIKTLIDYRDENPNEVGFQYISFLIDGDDILYLSRTALNKAKNYHDSNYITFHKIENFREL